MTLTLDITEANALVKILDAALRSGGVNILNEAAWLQNKLQKADAESKQPKIAVLPPAEVEQGAP